MAACSKLDSARVEELLNSGHSCSERNNHGETLLHVLIHSFVELFLEEQTVKKSSALDILSLLVRSGLDVNTVCEDMETPLHLLSHYDVDAKVIQALLAAGAKVKVMT
jgi:ankyrin repeat protein